MFAAECDVTGETYNLPLIENFKRTCTDCETCSTNDMHAMLQTNPRPDNGWYLFNYKFGTALQRWKRWEKHLSGQQPSLDQQIFPQHITFVDLSHLWTETIVLSMLLCSSAYAVVLYYFVRLYFLKNRLSQDESSVETENRGSMTDRSLGSDNSSLAAVASRFRHDFQTIRCMGHGGFGVVWECKNILDENTYAVKRIAIPDRYVV
ncbi:unnamed protein product [Soboliphyme baturini]|uniref:Protein kinase domain-containing protein n=1 Tax=Soboliphyme baturini TaxID=241478 RepID=A0A183J086_9BILA|nr:unnamed protein product [Soboliphyme baturini]